MSENTIVLLTLIFTALGWLVATLNAMFPRLLPGMGAFLLRTNKYLLVIIGLMVVIIGQQIYFMRG